MRMATLLKSCIVRSAIILSAASAEAPTALSQSAPIACNPQRTPSGNREPFSVVASGGISKGAYQAGALWSILALYRAKRDAQDSTGKAVELASLAGASAGNVNTLLMALEWAMPTQPPTAKAKRNERSSLLWKVWLSIGFDALLPSNDDASKLDEVIGRMDTLRAREDATYELRTDIGLTESLLHPGAFERAKQLVRESAASGSLLPCDIPFGVTLTKAVADSKVRVRDVYDAAVMRHASVGRFVVKTERQGFFTDTISQNLLPASAGLLIHPPYDSALSQLRLEDWFDHIQASGAFPVAFPAIRIRFYPTGSLWAEAQSVPRRLQDGLFLDGGVFDNNPLSLAWDLRAASEHAKDSVNYDSYNAWFVSPNARRTRLGSMPDSGVTAESLRGLGWHIGFAGRIIGASADYEMFSLERRLSSERIGCGPRFTRQLCVQRTDRYFPIFGATAASFGAFLGRPLREIDFYVGVYDGIYAWARFGPCAAKSERAAVAFGSPGFTELGRQNAADEERQCIKGAIEEAVRPSAGIAELSSEGRTLMRAFIDREFEGRCSSVDSALTRESYLLVLLDSLSAVEEPLTCRSGRSPDRTSRAQRLSRMEEIKKAVVCDEETFAVKFFCSGGLRLAIQSVGKEPYAATRGIGLDSVADEASYASLVKEFDQQVVARASALAFRQWRVESGAGDYRYLSKAAIRVGRSAALWDGWRYWHGRRTDFSSTPQRAEEGRRNVLWNVWPLTLDVAVQGGIRMSYALYGYANRGYEIALGPAVDVGQSTFGDATSAMGYGGRVQAKARTPRWIHSSLRRHVTWDAQVDYLRRDKESGVTISTGAALLSRRLRIGYRWPDVFSDRRSELPATRRIYIGLYDVPGILHLLLPQR